MTKQTPNAQLRAAREAAKKTQEETARAAGVSPRQYQRYESGESSLPLAPTKTALAIAKFLGVPLESII